jgi:hypothetical protein
MYLAMLEAENLHNFGVQQFADESSIMDLGHLPERKTKLGM